MKTPTINSRILKLEVLNGTATRTSVNAVESRTTSLESDIATAHGDISTLQGDVATLTQEIVDARNAGHSALSNVLPSPASQNHLTDDELEFFGTLPSTISDLMSNVEEVDADFVSISYNPSGAGGGAATFDPSDMRDLRALYDPSVSGSCLDSDLSPLSADGACRRWLDLSGNARHLEETDPAYQATFKATFVNGVSALDMGSAGRFSRVLNLGTEGYPEITIYMLRARKVSGAAWGNWFTNTAPFDGPNKLNAHAPYSSGASYFDYGNDRSYRLNPAYQALSYDHTAWHSLAFVRSRQRLMLFVNGSLEASSSILAPLTAFTDSNETIYFGNYTTSQPANAYFGPLLIFGRALTPYELGQLDAYYSAIGYR